MENGVEIVDVSQQGERKSEEGEVPAEKAVGSDGLKDREGECVFEEAVDAPEHFHGQGSKLYPESEEAIFGSNGNLNGLEVLASRSTDESLVSGQEDDKFEEAFETPMEASRLEEGQATVIFDQKVDMVGGKSDGIHLDGIDLGGTENGLVRDDSDFLRDDQAVERKESSNKEGLTNDSVVVSEEGDGKEGKSNDQVVGSGGSGGKEGLRDDQTVGSSVESGSKEDLKDDLVEGSEESGENEVQRDGNDNF